MPCATEYHYEDDRALQIVTRAACDMARVLTRGGSIDHLTQATKDWIRAHNEEDEMESERRRLISEMSPYARRILGLE